MNEMAWQPIETAPMDGKSDILVWCPGCDETGYLAHAELCSTAGYLEPRDGYGAMADGVAPTHWMPLPAPPSATPTP